MSQYPSAQERKYVKVVPYFDYSIALYRAPADDPAFEVNGMPICDLYFVLDEMGENLLPVDAPLSSMFAAMAAISLYIRYNNDAWRRANPNKSLWSCIQENTTAENRFVEMMDFLRDVQDRLAAFEPGDSDFGDDPVEWKKNTKKFMDDFLAKMRGHQPSQTYGPDGKPIK